MSMAMTASREQLYAILHDIIPALGRNDSCRVRWTGDARYPSGGLMA